MAPKTLISAVGFVLAWSVILPIFALCSLLTVVLCALVELSGEWVVGRQAPRQDSASTREIARRLCLGL